MNYRLLPVAEWPKVEPMFNGNPMPSPLAASIAVAEDGEEIKGLLVIQLVLHMEPLILKDPHINFRRLVETVEGLLPEGSEYWAFAPNAEIEGMCELNEMAHVPYNVYRKCIGGM